MNRGLGPPGKRRGGHPRQEAAHSVAVTTIDETMVADTDDAATAARCAMCPLCRCHAECRGWGGRDG